MNAVPYTPSHDHLVQRAAAWLRSKGCGVVFTELVTMQTEEPDAIGWRDSATSSYLVECKASRSDFLADRRKSFRRGDVPALGAFRYFMCRPDLIKPEELPPRWGLLYCYPRKILLVEGRDPTCWNTDVAQAYRHDVNHVGEIKMLYSALNRLKIDLGELEFNRRVHQPFSQRHKERLQARAQARLAQLPSAADRWPQSVE